MTVAHDAATESSTWTTTPDPFTFTHTPVGTPRGVLVQIVDASSSADNITAVTYGGVTCTRVATAADTAGEVSRVYSYFLGASIPTGAQTVSIDHSADANTRHAVCITVTAAGDTEITMSATDALDQVDPVAILDTSTVSSLRYAVIKSGLPNPASLTMLSGMTAVHDHTYSVSSERHDRQTTASTGSFSIGWTSASDDVAAVYVAISEIAAAVTVTPAVIAVVAALPTPSVLASVTVTPAVFAVVAALPTPTILAASTVTPAVVPLVVSLPTPTIAISAVVTPAVVAVVAALPTPSILAASKVTPAVIPLAALLPTPTVVGGASAIATPATIAATVSLPTPATSVDAIVTPAGIAVIASLPTPAVTTPGLVTPAGISVVVTLPTPLATVGAITFWSPNPVLYDPIGPGDQPPWN